MHALQCSACISLKNISVQRTFLYPNPILLCSGRTQRVWPDHVASGWRCQKKAQRLDIFLSHAFFSSPTLLMNGMRSRSPPHHGHAFPFILLFIRLVCARTRQPRRRISRHALVFAGHSSSGGQQTATPCATVTLDVSLRCHAAQTTIVCVMATRVERLLLQQ